VVPPTGQVVTVMVIVVIVNRRVETGVDVEGLAVVIVLEPLEDGLLEVELAGPELELEPVALEEPEEPATDPEELDPVLEPDPVVDAEELEEELTPPLGRELVLEDELELEDELVLEDELEVVFKPF